MKNVVALTMVFTLGLIQMGTNKAAATRLQRKQQQRQQTVDILQCYVCENCPDNIEEQPEMALCGGVSTSVVSTAIAAMTLPALVNGTTKAPELSEEYAESDYDEEDGDYNEGDEKKAQRTLTSTTKQTTSATTTTTTVIPITTTTSNTMQIVLENKLPEEDFNSYEDESESEESIKTTAATMTTTSTSTTAETSTITTTTTTPPNVSVNNIPAADFDSYEYEYMEDEEDYDLDQNGGVVRQSNPDPNVCYSIKLRNNVTEITNRGCATLIRGNKALTCQSLSKGMPILECLVCDTNGCNSYSNQFVDLTVKPSASQGLKVNFWAKILSVAVLIVAIIIRPQL